MDIVKYTEDLKLQELFDDLVIDLANGVRSVDRTVMSPIGRTWVRLSYTGPNGLMFTINPEDGLASRAEMSHISFTFQPSIRFPDLGIRWAMNPQYFGRNPQYFGRSKDNCDVLLYDYIAVEMYRTGKAFVSFVGETEGTVGKLISKIPEAYPKTLTNFTKNAFTEGNPNSFVEHLACMSIAMRRLIFKTGLSTKDKNDISYYAKKRAESRCYSTTDIAKMRVEDRSSRTSRSEGRADSVGESRNAMRRPRLSLNEHASVVERLVDIISATKGRRVVQLRPDLMYDFDPSGDSTLVRILDSDRRLLTTGFANKVCAAIQSDRTKDLVLFNFLGGPKIIYGVYKDNSLQEVAERLDLKLDPIPEEALLLFAWAWYMAKLSKAAG